MMLGYIFSVLLGALCATIAIALLIARSPSFADEFNMIVNALKSQTSQPEEDNDKEE